MQRARLSVVVYLGLGANLGDRVATLGAAVGALRDAGIDPLRLSPVYECDYVGPGGPQPPYLDAVLEARTALAPLVLLDRTQEVERRCGRSAGTHLQPRTLDVDVLLYGEWTVRHPRLVIPHPRLHERRFALQPLADLGVLGRWPALERGFAALGSRQPLHRVADIDIAVLGGARAVQVE
jgi:2-amino-4-hydroxy-6-hydroxymethyldihydropteridine diphosphokinase